ncbi:hypothetical protein KC19_2G051000 [Ceratodon purpureus]|uniref:Uncharacterized protein n=1 Tax=Ceratodon purpureus TaxID=3225 RepID=A0A8T0IU99_CERPU|nr:hypothetical protein KC19_2G051000 [Ceratodon purpureus]
MNADSESEVPSAMTDDGPDVVAGEQDITAHPQYPAMTVSPPNAYRNASLTIGAPVPDHEPVLGFPFLNVLVAGPHVVQKAKVVREVKFGPGITLGYLSLDDYKFIMNLFVIEGY